jgi:uncharacterized protein (TIGR02246 family)
MQRLSCVFILLATPALLAASGQAPAATKNIDQAIKAVSDQYTKAVLAGDAAAVAALYTDDAIEMPPHEPPEKGRAAIQQYYERILKQGKMSRFSLDHLETRAAGDVGFDVGT